MKAPTIEDVKSAARVLQGKAFRTPLIQSEALDQATGAKIYIKPENLQRTGSFKFRGAFNAISRLSEEMRSRGIAASSSGNHAQGVAAAAAMFGSKATIVMPDDAPALKITRTRNHGAEVVFYDRATEDREAVVESVVEASGAVFIHPFNNTDVIAGQGTVGLEIAEDLVDADVTPDRVLVCTGGGGLTAGVALAVNSQFLDAKIHSVEPEGFDDYKRSLETGQIQANSRQAGSICDAILTPSPGSIGFEINREILSDGLVITDEQARAAVRFAYHDLKLVTEPGGAAALAGLLSNAERWTGETIVVVISGGNIDPPVFSEILESQS
ncbi:MAG: threonine/serine dehydratase [Pseudomonadota bacterium]